MRAHEETWHTNGAQRSLVMLDDDIVCEMNTIAECGKQVGVRQDRARLAAQAPAMARLLLKFVALNSNIQTCTSVDDAYQVAVDEAQRVLRAAGVIE